MITAYAEAGAFFITWRKTVEHIIALIYSIFKWSGQGHKCGPWEQKKAVQMVEEAAKEVWCHMQEQEHQQQEWSWSSPQIWWAYHVRQIWKGLFTLLKFQQSIFSSFQKKRKVKIDGKLSVKNHRCYFLLSWRGMKRYYWLSMWQRSAHSYSSDQALVLRIIMGCWHLWHQNLHMISNRKVESLKQSIIIIWRIGLKERLLLSDFWVNPRALLEYLLNTIEIPGRLAQKRLLPKREEYLKEPTFWASGRNDNRDLSFVVFRITIEARGRVMLLFLEKESKVQMPNSWIFSKGILCNIVFIKI